MTYTATLKPRIEKHEATLQPMAIAQQALGAARRTLADDASFRSTTLVLDSALQLLSNTT